MSRPASKFSGLLSAVQQPAQTAADPALIEPVKDVPAESSAPTPAAPPSAAPASAPRRGRPAGKRSDPEFDQVTAYIRRQTYRDVRIALLTQGHGREFSELVEELLAHWLQSTR